MPEPILSTLQNTVYVDQVDSIFEANAESCWKCFSDSPYVMSLVMYMPLVSRLTTTAIQKSAINHDDGC